MSANASVQARQVRDISATNTRLEVGFWFVASSYLLVMAMGTVPSPLYGLYQERDGFSTFTITLIFACFALGSTTSLFLAGHMSDWHGRKPVLLPGLALAAGGALVFLLWRSVAGLCVGRLLGGLSVGFVSATATAYLTELHVRSRPQASMTRAQLAGTVLNVGGLAVGALIAGLLAQYVRAPLSTTYIVFLVAFAIVAVGIALTPETRERTVPMPKYRPQRIAVPARARRQFLAAVGGAAIAFAALGLFTSLAGVILVRTLRHNALSLAGATVFIVFAGAVAAQFIAARWPLRRVLAGGMALVPAGLALVVVSVWLSTPSLALFLIGGFVSGIGCGAILKGSLVTVMTIAEPAHRAESTAGVLLGGYLGLSVPAIGVGVALQQGASSKATLLGFAIVVASALLAAAPALLREPTLD